QLQTVIGQVDFPPVESLPGRSRIEMVVVVPPFAHRDQRQEKIVPAVVASVITLGPVHMRKRINRAGAVNQRNGRNKKSPNEHLRSIRSEMRGIDLQQFAEHEHPKTCNRRNEDVESAQKTQLRTLGKAAEALQSWR